MAKVNGCMRKCVKHERGTDLVLTGSGTDLRSRLWANKRAAPATRDRLLYLRYKLRESSLQVEPAGEPQIDRRQHQPVIGASRAFG